MRFSAEHRLPIFETAFDNHLVSQSHNLIARGSELTSAPRFEVHRFSCHTRPEKTGEANNCDRARAGQDLSPIRFKIAFTWRNPIFNSVLPVSSGHLLIPYLSVKGLATHSSSLLKSAHASF